jgi:hypothetical protein
MAKREKTPEQIQAEKEAKAAAAQAAKDDADRAEARAVSKTPRTVTVACKMPHGVVIRDFVKTTVHEQVMGGGSRPVEVFRPVGPKIRIKGPTVPALFVRHVEVVGGYAITEGVPADVFERWVETNKEAPFIANELIYGHEKGDRVRSWAKERDEVRSGMEPLSVDMTMTKDGRQVFTDPRVRLAGADQVVDGAAEPKAA